MEVTQICAVCLKEMASDAKIQLKCSHIFCNACLKNYINVLKSYRQLTP